jgi:predicted transcriptional regulator
MHRSGFRQIKTYNLAKDVGEILEEIKSDGNRENVAKYERLINNIIDKKVAESALGSANSMVENVG